MASLTFRFSTGITSVRTSPKLPKHRTNKISCVNWDPEGILGPPKTGLIARQEFKRRMERDADAREEFENHMIQEKARRQSLRESRVAPVSLTGLVEYFLDTEAQEIEFEIGRLRTRLNEEFFSHLKLEIGQIRFAVAKTEDMEDRLVELEALQKALKEGIEAYDKMQIELLKANGSLKKILSSKDVKATLLEMVELNELNRPLLALLDENIASANRSNQKEAAEFMEKLRGAMLKYMTV